MDMAGTKWTWRTRKQVLIYQEVEDMHLYIRKKHGSLKKAYWCLSLSDYLKFLDSDIPAIWTSLMLICSLETFFLSLILENSEKKGNKVAMSYIIHISNDESWKQYVIEREPWKTFVNKNGILTDHPLNKRFIYHVN